jgi:hypothetical protein
MLTGKLLDAVHGLPEGGEVTETQQDILSGGMQSLLMRSVSVTYVPHDAFVLLVERVAI